MCFSTVENKKTDIIETISTTNDGEDEESTPIEVLPSPNHNELTNESINNHSSSSRPNSKATTPIAPVTADNKNAGQTNPNDIEGEVSGQVEQWVVQPASQGCLYKCRITRDRKGMDRGLFPLYYLHLEREYGKKIFLLAGKRYTYIGIRRSHLFNIQHTMFTGRKRKKSKTSNYIVSCDPTDLSRQADGFVGKLRSNVFGTTFFVYDNGSKTNVDEARQDMAVIVYVGALVTVQSVCRSRFMCFFFCYFCRIQTFWDLKDQEI